MAPSKRLSSVSQVARRSAKWRGVCSGKQFAQRAGAKPWHSSRPRVRIICP